MTLKIKHAIISILNVVILIILMENFGVLNGLMGFAGVMVIIAAYKIWIGRKQVMEIIDMGANQLHYIEQKHKEAKNGNLEKDKKRKENK